jgi:hypothetical protein
MIFFLMQFITEFGFPYYASNGGIWKPKEPGQRTVLFLQNRLFDEINYR